MLIEQHSTLDSILALLSNPPKATFLVIGDLIYDEYLNGIATRISPEAPVPVILGTDKNECLGGAGNVVANLRGMSATVIPMGVIGDDEAGNKIKELLKRKGCEIDHIYVDKNIRTTTKTRIVANGQQVVRFDWDAEAPKADIMKSIVSDLPNIIDNCDMVIISDYQKGFCSTQVIKCAIDNANKSGKMIIIDPKRDDFSIYSQAFCITPNLLEVQKVMHTNLTSDVDIRNAAEYIHEKYEIEVIIITRGKDGMSILWDKIFETIPTKAREVYDVSGAGDTVLGVIARCFNWGINKNISAQVANIAAGIVVSKRGTSPIDIIELHSKISKEVSTF